MPIVAGGKLVTQVYRLLDEVNGIDLVFPNVGQAMSHTLNEKKRVNKLPTITYIDKWQQKLKATPYVFYEVQRNPTQLVNESQIATNTENDGNTFFENFEKPVPDYWRWQMPPLVSPSSSDDEIPPLVSPSSSDDEMPPLVDASSSDDEMPPLVDASSRDDEMPPHVDES